MHIIEWMENGECCLWRTPSLAEAVRLMNELRRAGIKPTHIFEE